MCKGTLVKFEFHIDVINEVSVCICFEVPSSVLFIIIIIVVVFVVFGAAAGVLFECFFF